MSAVVPLITLLTLTDGNPMLMPALRTYTEQRAGEFSGISPERKEELQQIADFVRQHIQAGTTAKLTFICTHNSRRSHLAQVWAQTAAAYFEIPHVETFSGGTEATAFNPRAVAALKRAGFDIPEPSPGRNPHYQVSFASNAEPLDCFSKVYSESPNPAADFCAVMTCSQADKNCPVVAGAARRVAIPYDDPKANDGTPQESQKYDERCRQIAREMLYLFSRVTMKSAANSE